MKADVASVSYAAGGGLTTLDASIILVQSHWPSPPVAPFRWSRVEETVL